VPELGKRLSVAKIAAVFSTNKARDGPPGRP
jgi:hypothetical protein